MMRIAKAITNKGTAKKDTIVITQMLRKTQSAEMLADTIPSCAAEAAANFATFLFAH